MIEIKTDDPQELHVVVNQKLGIFELRKHQEDKRYGDLQATLEVKRRRSSIEIEVKKINH